MESVIEELQGLRRSMSDLLEEFGLLLAQIDERIENLEDLSAAEFS